MSDKLINGVIVSFSYGMIAGSKRDPTITKEITTEKNAGDDAGSWSNKLFPASTCQKRNSFTELRRHLGAMRNWHYDNTYVWEDEMWRLLPQKRIDAYKQVVETDGKARANELLNIFINDLPNLIDLARIARGEAFVEKDYPTVDEVRAKFDYSVRYRPISAADGLDPVLFKEAISELNDLHARRLLEANETLMRRFMEPFQTLAEQLKDPTKRKIGQVLETIRDFTDQIPSLDLSGNQDLLTMAEQIKTLFADVTPEALKQDEEMRKMLGNTVTSVLTSLDRFGKVGQERKFA